MKSTAITRGLLVALSGFAHYAALASASADPEEKALGEHLRALDLTAPTAALAEVKAPSLGDLFAVHAKAVELTGSDKGICGGLDALAQNSSARGAAASLSRMALVDQMLAAAVNPQPDASGVTPPRKLTPAMAAGQRAQFVASADKPIDDLASFIRLAHPLPALNQVEDAGSGSAADLAAGDIDPEYARHANAGKIAGGAQ